MVSRSSPRVLAFFRRAVGAAALAAAGAVSIVGWARPRRPAPPVRALSPLDTTDITADMVASGRRIFHGKGMCFACHGTNLEGGPIAPTLKPHNWKDAKGGDLDAIFYIDTHGVGGTAMVAHPGGISDAEASNVAAYIWSVGHRGVKP